jgi:hypothetical protein
LHTTSLSCPQERLDQQRKERAEKGQAYSSTFKPQRSKDEAKERRKAILSSIGEVRQGVCVCEGGRKLWG